MEKLSKSEIKQLIDRAKSVRKNAFCHRSNHQIGASVLCYDGKIYGGCNVESVISGLGTCAERLALNHAIVHGHYDIKAVCTVDSALTPSCGACLQYMLMFSQICNKEIIVITADIYRNFTQHKLSELLPEGYITKNNVEEIEAYSKLRKAMGKQISRRRSKTDEKMRD